MDSVHDDIYNTVCPSDKQKQISKSWYYQLWYNNSLHLKQSSNSDSRDNLNLVYLVKPDDKSINSSY